MSLQEILKLADGSMWCKALVQMEILTQKYKCADFRSSSDLSALEDVGKSLGTAVKSLGTQATEQEMDGDIIRYLTETFRCLRNACAGCSRNQTYLEGTDCVDNSHELLNMVYKISRSEIDTLLKCTLQFIGNFCVGNRQNQKIVCDKFLEVFRHLVNSTNNDIINYTCMVLHNCLLSGETETTLRQLPHQLSFTDDNLASVVCAGVQATIHHDLEWGLFLIEDLLQTSNFCKIFFEKFSLMERLFIVEVLNVMLRKLDGREGTRQVVAMDNLEYLTSDLKMQSLQILQAGLSDSDHSQALLLVKILEGIGQATSMHSLYGNFQEDSELLVSSINLLHGVHSIGREGPNHFSSVEKMTERDNIDEDHPAYGLKRDLIRLIANLVYRHRGNQDKVREMDGIALILDQSNMDGRNPYKYVVCFFPGEYSLVYHLCRNVSPRLAAQATFLQRCQWVVLAVRNLLENNEDNKRYLASLRLEGLSNNVEMLQEFGVNAEVRGDKVVVKPSQDRAEK